MRAYLDSSVILRIVLDEPGALSGWDEFEERVTSDLAEVECHRTLDRLRLRGQLSEQTLVERREALYRLLDACDAVELDRPILRRAAAPFPVALGTLDALHLATALAWRDDRDSGLSLATHDQSLAQAARSLGMRVVG